MTAARQRMPWIVVGLAVLLVGLAVFLVARRSDSARALTCRRFADTIRSYAALRTHAGQPDFLQAAGIMTKDLQLVTDAAARTHDQRLITIAGQARGDYAAALDAFEHPRPGSAGDLQRRQVDFAFSMAEADVACGQGVTPVPASPRTPSTSVPGPTRPSTTSASGTSVSAAMIEF